MNKYKVLIRCTADGETLNPGDVVELPDATANKLKGLSRPRIENYVEKPKRGRPPKQTRIVEDIETR